MPGKVTKEVELLFTASDEATDVAREIADRIDESISEQFVNFAAKALAAAGAVEAGLKGFDAAVRLVQGDLEGALEALESLPFGIGPVVQSIRSVAESLSGVESQIRSLRMESEQALLAVQERRFLAGITDDTQRQLELIDASYEKAVKEVKDRIAEIQEAGEAGLIDFSAIAADFGDGVNQRVKETNDALEVQAAIIEELAGERREAVARIQDADAARRRQEFEQERDAEVKRLQELDRLKIESIKRSIAANAQEQTEGDKVFQEGLDAALEAEQALAEVKARLRDQSLREQGNVLQAELEQINQAFEAQIAAAKSAEEAKTLELLRASKIRERVRAEEDKQAKQQAQEAERLAKEADAAASRRAGITLVTDAFRGQQVRQEGGALLDVVARETREQTRTQKESLAALKDIAEGIREGTIQFVQVRL